MKIIIFGYNNFDGITTSKYFDKHEHILLVHSFEQREKFLKSGRVSKMGKILTTGNPKGLAYNRNYALDRLMKKDEWAMFWVDDLIKVTWYKRGIYKGLLNVDINISNQSEFRKDFKVECSADDFINYCEKLTRKADNEGVKLVGFSSTNNPLFRPKRFKYYSYVDGRCFLIKKTFLRFDENCQSMDDMFITAANLESFGKVLVESWVLPECTRFKKGINHGSKDDRAKNKLRQTKYLVKRFPTIIHTEPRSSAVGGVHVKIKFKPPKI